jgi:hypothetical protein
MFRVLFAVALLLAPIAAGAVTLQNQAFSRWKIQDACIADSVKAHPDRDAASQHLRDVDVDKCLSDHGLPGRTDMAPPTETPPPPAK